MPMVVSGEPRLNRYTESTVEPLTHLLMPGKGVGAWLGRIHPTAALSANKKKNSHRVIEFHLVPAHHKRCLEILAARGQDAFVAFYDPHFFGRIVCLKV